jgi:hypothetical protein
MELVGALLWDEQGKKWLAAWKTTVYKEDGGIYQVGAQLQMEE